MHVEQAGNIALVTRQVAGLVLWKQNLTKRSLGGALEEIVTDFRYQQNMHRLRQIQNRYNGAESAAREMVKFLEGDE